MKAKISLIAAVFLSFSLFLCSKEDTKETKKEIVLESPANHSLLKNPIISFKWNHVSDAKNYEIALSSVSDFSKISLNQRTENPEFESSDSFSPGIYYWKVRAEKENSQWGDWSHVSDFTIIDIPRLIFPAANNSIGSFALRFQWEEVSYGVEYQIMAAADSSFSSPVIDEYTETACYTPLEEIAVGTYYWKVRGKDSLLNWREWSETERFDVIDPCGIFTDPRDGYTYKTIKIGDQVWLAENLRAVTYRDGTPIANVTCGYEWSNLTGGAYCAFGNDESNAETYGYLYNWYAVKDSRGLAPEGWHVPTNEEWTKLENYLIANGYNWDGTTTGNKIAKSLASTSGWFSSSEEGDIGNNQQNNNSTGFSALPGGCRNYVGYFDRMKGYAYFWSSTEYDSYPAWGRALVYDDDEVDRYIYPKKTGFSVRLVRD